MEDRGKNIPNMRPMPGGNVPPAPSKSAAQGTKPAAQPPKRESVLQRIISSAEETLRSLLAQIATKLKSPPPVTEPVIDESSLPIIPRGNAMDQYLDKQETALSTEEPKSETAFVAPPLEKTEVAPAKESLDFDRAEFAPLLNAVPELSPPPAVDAPETQPAEESPNSPGDDNETTATEPIALPETALVGIAAIEPEPAEERHDSPADNANSDAATGLQALPEPAPYVPHLYLEDKLEGSFTCRVWGYEGSTNHNYQDAAAADPNTGFVAIADGTTLGGRSEIVAQEAVRRFVNDKPDLLGDELGRAAWWDGTRKAWYRVRREEYNDASANEQTRWDKGGSATFLGAQFGDDGTYRLYTVGDCSLLWFDASFTQCVAVEGAEVFNSHPLTLHTDNENVPEELFATSNEKERPADAPVALLCTDALAKFLLEQKPWETDPEGFGSRLETGTAESIRDWLLPHKETYHLDPDDYTFILIRFPVSPDNRD